MSADGNRKRVFRTGAVLVCAALSLALGAAVVAGKGAPAPKQAGAAAPRQSASPERAADLALPAGLATPPYEHGVWDPFVEMDMMLRNMRRLYQETTRHFDALEPGWRTEVPQTFAPQIDLREEEDRYILRADLPGMDESGITVTVDGRTVTIAGQRAEVVEEQEGDFLRRERVHGAFQRTMTLPGPVEKNEAVATHEEGVLKIVLPKADEPIGPVVIPIE